MPKVPRQLGLTKIKEKRIIGALGAVPPFAPDIAIKPIRHSDCNPVVFANDEFPLLPVVGAQGIYADYDALTGECREATLVWNRRRIGVRHMMFLDSYSTGGAWDDGGFKIYWHGRSITRVTGSAQWRLNEYTGVLEKAGRRGFGAPAQVEWADSEECTGPREGSVLYSSGAGVRVADRLFECARVIRILPEDPKNYGPEPEDPYVRWHYLDDIYLDNEGRVVLTRRYSSKEYHTSSDWGADEEAWDEWAIGRTRIAYNAIEFRHYFDMLTEVSLGWPNGSPLRLS